MTQQEIISKVRIILNEIGEEQTLSLLSENTLKLDDYIKSVIPEAVSFVQANSHTRCVNKKSINTGFQNGTDYTALCIPSDFVSLIAVKLSQWRRSCIVAFTMDSEEYKQQCNQYTKTGNNKPVCVIGYHSGTPAFLLYPKAEITDSETVDSKVDMFVYEAKYTDGLSLDSNDPLSLAVCYMCAALVYQIFENKASSDSMQATALSLIPQ